MMSVQLRPGENHSETILTCEQQGLPCLNCIILKLKKEALFNRIITAKQRPFLSDYISALYIRLGKDVFNDQIYNYYTLYERIHPMVFGLFCN